LNFLFCEKNWSCGSCKKKYSQKGINFKYILKVPKCKQHAKGCDIHWNLWLLSFLSIMKHCCFIMSSIDISKQWFHYNIYIIT
jgi:hypothetical protein